jgi:hypothetical protein
MSFLKQAVRLVPGVNESPKLRLYAEVCCGDGKRGRDKGAGRENRAKDCAAIRGGVHERASWP